MAKPRRKRQQPKVLDMATEPDATGETELPPPLQVRRKIRCPNCSGTNVIRFSQSPSGMVVYYHCREESCRITDDRRGGGSRLRTFQILRVD